MKQFAAAVCLSGICLFLISIDISCQTNKSNTDFTPPIDFIPKSPEATHIEQYGNLSVNHSTGVPDISIPLHTIEYGDVKIPISISYLATGIKVNDISSSVGLKWMLNAGGQVSRNIIGKADEDECSLDLLEHYYNGGKEATPDILYQFEKHDKKQEK